MTVQLRRLAIVAALLALAEGAEPEPIPENTGSQSSQEIKWEDVCYFFHPSYSCIEKCEKLEKEPYCPDEKQGCKCKERAGTFKTTQKDSNYKPSTQTSDSPHTDSLGIDLNFADKCIESFPTYSCDRKCENLGKVPYCHDETEKCLCMDKDAENEPTEAESNLPSTHQSGTAISNGRVVKIEDYCAFGRIPSVQCKVKCKINDLEPYCGALSKACLCKQIGSIPPTPPAQDSYCWFGEWPTTACARRCGERGAFCVPHSLTNECRCKGEEQASSTSIAEETQTQDSGTQTDDAETQSPSPLRHFLIYINLGSLVGSAENQRGKGERYDEEEDNSEVDEDDDLSDESQSAPGSVSPTRAEVKNQPIPKPEVKLAHAAKVEPRGISRDQLWTLQTAAAAGIIVILVALLSIEVYSMYARRRSEKGLANVFNTLPTVNKT